MEIKRFRRLLLLVSLLVATSCWGAADVKGRSSTQLLWFNDFYNGRQVELAEYVRLSATSLDNAGKLAFNGYGRGSQDFTNGEGFNSRLYYLYLDWRDAYDKKLDARLGRQFVNLSAGSAILDGARLDVRNIGPVAVTVAGGRDVIYDIDGENGMKNYAFGVSAALAGYRKVDLDVSWLRKWDDGDVSRDTLGASFKEYLYDKFKIYGNARYDLTAEVVNEFLAGAKYFPTARTVFTGEWYQSYPTFDATSIYSVFAVNRYREGLLRVDHTVSAKVSLNAGYTRENFGDDGRANVYEIGCRFHPNDTLAVGLAYDKRDGYGGKLDGFQGDVAYDVRKGFQVAGGFAYDVYQRDSMTGDETAQKYWVAGRYQVRGNVRVSARLEDDVNKYYDSNFQGRLVLDYDF